MCSVCAQYLQRIKDAYRSFNVVAVCFIGQWTVHSIFSAVSCSVNIISSGGSHGEDRTGSGPTPFTAEEAGWTFTLNYQIRLVPKSDYNARPELAS